ncbi:SdiA-regulated protein [Pseudomonas sp. StFLB209]|uniref:SdiA-regulated domain-containing protein n=1 Tax=Pseudomonas sp. StFLB209 TaxID=1028989 RepID=UPI0004F68913|nr:SdiA-regulated domain-containing protein [Pseudomonas sp. StFLB209]BAP42669.1 SdiA-regulated protein [Pseudomonas sp. StFLB209]
MAIPSSSLSRVPAAAPRCFWSRWYSGVLLALAIAYGVAYAMHWDDRAVLLVQEALQSKDERNASVWLPDYKVTIDAKVLPGMADDEASDLAYNPVTRTLFAVMGKNPFLVELSLKGDVLRKIPMEGWSNPEGLTVLSNGLVAITDERQQLLSIIKVDADTTRLRLVDAVKYDLGHTEKKNKGFEGVIWDAKRQQLLLGQERPAAMFSWKSDGSTLLAGEKQRLEPYDLDVRNLSALSVDPRTGHVLVLSADSHLLLELDEQGRQVSFMSLLGGVNGLKDTIPRAEGVAIDEQGTVYMVSEPNLFYSFSNK